MLSGQANLQSILPDSLNTLLVLKQWNWNANFGLYYTFECENNCELTLLQKNNNIHSAVRQHLRIR